MRIFWLLCMVVPLVGCSSSSGDSWNNSNNINNVNNINNINNSNNLNNNNNTNNLNNTGATNNLNNTNNTNAPIDTDGDGVPDYLDPCPLDNPDDSDGDGVCTSEDLCEGYNDAIDGDFDGVPDYCDPCPYDNPDDSDGDGVCDSIDACPGGDDKLDSDGDGVADYCDQCIGDDAIDGDGDGVPDCVDPCPLDNPDDSDGDGVCDTDDACPGGDDNLDTNGNGIPDDCENVGPGIYEYTRIPLGGMEAGVSVAMHPDNSYFVVLEYSDRIHIYDIASAQFSTIDLAPGGSAHIYFRDIKFHPSGEYAIITGKSTETTDHGVVFRFDDAQWRLTAPTPSNVVTPFPLTGVTTVVDYTAVEFALFEEVLLLGHNASSTNRIMYLISLDITTGAASYVHANNVGADAVDMTGANNVYGDPGVFIVGGPSGAFTAYYTEVTGTPEFTIGPGNNNIGNANHTDAYPTGEYALVISSSGDAIYRFEAGQLNSYSEALRFSTRRLWNVVFQPNGLRALILGQYQSIYTNTFGGVFEYRHGHYSCVTPFTNCEVTEVSIPSFNSPPWNASSSTLLYDAAWRSDCDGGIIVGGSASWSSPYAFIARFQIMNGTTCTW